MIPTPRFVNVLYCDDVRSELGNKMTYAGIYNSGIAVERSPQALDTIKLPKLHVVITAQTPKEDPFQSLKFRILHDGELRHEIEMPSKALSLSISQTIENPAAMFHLYGAIIHLQALTVEKSGTLQVVAITEREEMMTPAFQIVLTDITPA